MKKGLWLMATMTLLLAGPALASPALVVIKGSSGQRYAVSPGTRTGSCLPTWDGVECTDGANRASASKTEGCGEVAGQGFCLVVPEDWRTVYPAGTSTLECEGGKKYELSDGADGECGPNDGVEMNCGSAGASNFASASCETGCGAVSGSGSCKVK